MNWKVHNSAPGCIRADDMTGASVYICNTYWWDWGEVLVYLTSKRNVNFVVWQFHKTFPFWRQKQGCEYDDNLLNVTLKNLERINFWLVTNGQLSMKELMECKKNCWKEDCNVLNWYFNQPWLHTNMLQITLPFRKKLNHWAVVKTWGIVTRWTTENDRRGRRGRSTHMESSAIFYFA